MARTYQVFGTAIVRFLLFSPHVSPKRAHALLADRRNTLIRLRSSHLRKHRVYVVCAGTFFRGNRPATSARVLGTIPVLVPISSTLSPRSGGTSAQIRWATASKCPDNTESKHSAMSSYDRQSATILPTGVVKAGVHLTPCIFGPVACFATLRSLSQRDHPGLTASVAMALLGERRGIPNSCASKVLKEKAFFDPTIAGLNPMIALECSPAK